MSGKRTRVDSLRDILDADHIWSANERLMTVLAPGVINTDWGTTGRAEQSQSPRDTLCQT